MASTCEQMPTPLKVLHASGEALVLARVAIAGERVATVQLSDIAYYTLAFQLRKGNSRVRIAVGPRYLGYCG